MSEDVFCGILCLIVFGGCAVCSVQYYQSKGQDFLNACFTTLFGGIIIGFLIFPFKVLKWLITTLCIGLMSLFNALMGLIRK